MAEKPGDYKWDNPIIARDDAEAGKPALRNVLDYVQRLPEQLRRFGRLVDAVRGPAVQEFFNAQGLSVVMRGYGQKSTSAVGAWERIYTYGPRGYVEGPLCGITNVTADLAAMLFPAQGFRMVGDQYTVLCTDVERAPRVSIHVQPALASRNAESVVFCGTSGNGASVIPIGSSSLVAFPATFEFVVLGQHVRTA